MNTYTKKISSLEAIEVKKLLDNCSFDTVQYAQWRAKNSDFQVIYYDSGKLLIQGKNVDDIACKVDEILGIKTISTDNKLEHYVDKYIGTDESGKGDFFGPLVIAGVQVNDENKKMFIDAGIKDSKKLDDNKIKKLSALIRNNSVHSVVVITPVKYNELYSKFNNLNKLLAWGHARAIENIMEKSPCSMALADKFGDESLIQNALMSKGRTIELRQMVRAESDIAVAAASVIARAEFVKRMEEMEAKYELSLSKGASSKVVEQAKEFVKKYSYDRLNEIAKMHFKTVKEIKN